MGVPFLVKLNQSDPTLSFYICRMCRTHIALGDDFNYHYTPETGVIGGLFDKVVNVQVDESAHYRKVGPYTAADVHCLTCGNHLGWKYVKVPQEDPAVEKDMVQLQMEKLLMWDGNSVADAQVMEPVPGPYLADSQTITGYLLNHSD